MTRLSLLAYPVLLAGASLSVGVAAQPAPYDCQNVARRVDIGAQPMKAAIAALSRQTNCPISVDAGVDDLGSRTVKGRMTPIDAAVGLVKGTGLEAKPVKQGIGIGRYEQDAVDAKVAVLAARVDAAVKAGRITPARGAALHRRLAGVASGTHRLARRQGFVSAAERASYQRTIADVGRALSRA